MTIRITEQTFIDAAAAVAKELRRVPTRTNIYRSNKNCIIATAFKQAGVEFAGVGGREVFTKYPEEMIPIPNDLNNTLHLWRRGCIDSFTYEWEVDVPGQPDIFADLGIGSNHLVTTLS